MDLLSEKLIQSLKNKINFKFFLGGGQNNPAQYKTKGAFMMADMDDCSDSSDEEESFK